MKKITSNYCYVNLETDWKHQNSILISYNRVEPKKYQVLEPQLCLVPENASFTKQDF